MVCDICKKNEATVHLTQILDNKMLKIDLCEVCSKAKGLQEATGFSLADLQVGLGAAELGLLDDLLRAGSLPERQAAVALLGLCDQAEATMLLARAAGRNREVAVRLGISEKTVEEQVARGMRRCQEHFRRRGVVP